MGLIYYPDSNPGISRVRRGRGFSYIAPDGSRIADQEERARLAALAVPPAYVDVWMAPLPNAHLLATGRDARGRKQYRYHPKWTEARDKTKFDRLADVGAALPRLRRWITERLTGPPGDRDTAVAAVLALMDRGALRPGDPSYTEQNGSYGALTLEDRHLKIDGPRIVLRYKAKGGAKIRKVLTGARLAKVLHASADLPGPRLFEFEGPDDTRVPVRSEHVSDVLGTVSDGAITPKSLRTWAGTLAAFRVARSVGPSVTISAMAEAAAERLHNTPTVARNSYIHPAVIDIAQTETDVRNLKDRGQSGLRQGEAALIGFLEG